MASQKWADDQLGKRIRELREHKGWSQPQLAEKLSARRTPMHATTIAKIEAGTRSVRINEAVALAETFGITVDGLLGRSTPDKSALIFELAGLWGDARNVANWIKKARDQTFEIVAQARLIGEGFEDPAIDPLNRYARELDDQLEAPLDTARKLIEAVDNAMGEPREKAAQAPNETDTETPCE